MDCVWHSRQCGLDGVLPKKRLSRMFVSGRKYPRECRAARIDVDRATAEAVRRW